jgi:predicted Zn-dependent protease
MTLSPEKTLNAAKNQAIQQDSLRVISSNNVTVNGNSAIELTADLNAQVRLMMYLIQYNGNIYKLTGLAETPSFNAFQPTFLNTFKSFKALTDAAKINVKPERIKIKTVAKDGTLQETLRSFNMPQNRMEELSILNGMKLTDKVTKGMLIKTVEKG